MEAVLIIVKQHNSLSIENITIQKVEDLACSYLILINFIPFRHQIISGDLLLLCYDLVRGIKSIRIQASHDCTDTSPFALLFLFGFPICGVTAEHVQGRPMSCGLGREMWGTKGGRRDDAAQMEPNRLSTGRWQYFGRFLSPSPQLNHSRRDQCHFKTAESQNFCQLQS